MACLAIGPIVIFTAVALTGTRVLPHWAAPGYLMLFPLLGAEVAAAIENQNRRVRGWLIATATSLGVLLVAVMTVAYLPWPAIASPTGKSIPHPLQESVDWTMLEAELERRGLASRSGLFIATTRWHEAGKIDYALGGKWPVLCLCRDPRGYGILAKPETHLGKGGLILGRDLSPERIKKIYGTYFEKIEELPPITITQAGRPVFDLSVYLGRTLRTSTETPNLLDPLSLGKHEHPTSRVLGQDAERPL
jgi:hypothetical protein